MKTMGFDQDVRRIGWAIADGQRIVEYGTIDRTKTTGRFHSDYDDNLSLLLYRCLVDGMPLYIEGIWLASGRGATAQNVRMYGALAEVAGEIKMVAREHNVPVHTVTPNEWRAAVLGKTGKRDDMKRLSVWYAEQVTGHAGMSDHVADACCIALYGAQDAKRATAV